jgi:SAM-dependent methyltransferase
MRRLGTPNSEVGITHALPLGRETMSSGLEHASNYHKWNYEWIAPYITGRVLDVGGGTGNHIAFLKDSQLVSIDLSASCIAELRERYKDLHNWSFEVGDITDDALVERLGERQFETVLSCNVFEHIRNDSLAFANASRLLKPGGNLVLLLPAHTWLFGSMDRLAGHFRRYSRDIATGRMSVAGLEVVSMKYVNIVGALGWYVNSRLIRQRDISSAGINAQIRMFDRLLIPILKRMEGRRAMPVGQSLLCVGRKPFD